MNLRPWLAVSVVLVGSGCHSVRPLWEPEEFLARAKPAVVYVRHRDLPPMAIAHPRLTGDTLRGTHPESNRPIAVAWADVMDVYARRLNSTRTVFAVTGVTLVSGLMLFAFLEDASGRLSDPCEFPTTAYEHDRDLDCGGPVR